MSKGTINRVILVGNLGADPETRTSPSGLAVASLRLATVENKKGQNGYEDVTEWHRVTVFGKTAEFIGQYASKGSKVLVEGRIETRKWQDKNGQDQYTTAVVANDAQILSSRSDSAKAPVSKPANAGVPFNDDIPF